MFKHDTTYLFLVVLASTLLIMVGIASYNRSSTQIEREVSTKQMQNQDAAIKDETPRSPQELLDERVFDYFVQEGYNKSAAAQSSFSLESITTLNQYDLLSRSDDTSKPYWIIETVSYGSSTFVLGEGYLKKVNPNCSPKYVRQVYSSRLGDDIHRIVFYCETSATIFDPATGKDISVNYNPVLDGFVESVLLSESKPVAIINIVKNNPPTYQSTGKYYFIDLLTGEQLDYVEIVD